MVLNGLAALIVEFCVCLRGAGTSRGWKGAFNTAYDGSRMCVEVPRKPSVVASGTRGATMNE